MKIFDPSSLFLRSFQAAINELGGQTGITFRNVHTEQSCESYFPKTKYGIPSFDWDKAIWESTSPSSDNENLMLEANHLGEFGIRQGDDDFYYFKTQLRSGFELSEVLEFIETADANRIGDPKWVRWNLRHLLEGIYLLMPEAPDLALIPYAGEKLLAERPDWVPGMTVPKEAMHDAFCASVSSRNDDLVIQQDGSSHMLGLFRHSEDSYFGDSSHIVLRFKKDISKMWMADFFENTLEGANVAARIFSDWKNLSQTLNSINLEMPSTKRDQVALSIETREAKRRYQKVIRDLMALREPARAILPLYRKRIQAVAGIHGELLDEIDAAQRPLPFFIEYPLHRWRKTDDHDRMEQIVRAKQLLTILIKSIVLLPLEEALAHSAYQESIRVLAADLSQKKPLSDGGWVELLSVLRTKYAEAAMSLPLFGDLLVESAKVEPHLVQLVAARNRFNHPPYDANGLVSAFKKKLPEVIGFLREHFSNRQFLIPKSMRFDGSRKLVHALMLTGRDTEFSSIEREVEGPLEAFPTGKIVAANSTGTQTLVLDRFFTGKSLKAETIDVGIFDRFEGDHACFEFVRGLGNAAEFDA